MRWLILVCLLLENKCLLSGFIWDKKITPKELALGLLYVCGIFYLRREEDFLLSSFFLNSNNLLSSLPSVIVS